MIKNKKIALITIATGKYLSFLPELYETASKHFLPGKDVKFVLFTDNIKYAEKITAGHGAKIFYIKHKQWPFVTLKRWHAFSEAERYLRDNFGYLYYIDADMVFHDDINDEIIGDLVATKHPGFYNKPRETFIYETRKESTAYVAPEEGEFYFIGAFQGGRTDLYLKAVNEMKKKTDQDLEKDMIAAWHDESHWNRYCARHKPDIILSPSYCYMEVCGNDFSKKIVMKPKNNENIRYSVSWKQLRKLPMPIKKIKSFLVSKLKKYTHRG